MQTTEQNAITLPALAEGEINAGLIFGEDGAPAHWLILLPGDADKADHATQTAWAKEQGGELPSRREQSLLFANCQQHFQRDWYWSGEQPDSDSAWYQHFGDGDQYCSHIHGKLRARAVRRLII